MLSRLVIRGICQHLATSFVDLPRFRCAGVRSNEGLHFCKIIAFGQFGEFSETRLFFLGGDKAFEIAARDIGHWMAREVFDESFQIFAN